MVTLFVYGPTITGGSIDPPGENNNNDLELEAIIWRVVSSCQKLYNKTKICFLSAQLQEKRDTCFYEKLAKIFKIKFDH